MRLPGDKCDDNQDTCSFAQALCVKFDVTFTVDADLDQDSIAVSCGR